MKSSFFIYILTFIYIIFSFITASAQNTLNRPEIEKFISTLPSINALVKVNEGEEAIQNSNVPSDITHTPITASLKLLRAQTSFPEFTTILNRAGFSSPEQWANIGDKVMMAFSAYQLKNPPNASAPSIEEIKQDLNSRLNNIKNNQFISNEQKQTLINKIQNSMALISDPNYIDNENISIISPYIDRLNSLLKEYQ